jgi:hypothetical protein
MPDDETLDAAAAAALMQQTRQHVRGLLGIKLPVLYTAWGAAWLVGLGGMWLSVRGQHPYTGPSGLASALLGVLLVAAAAVTIATVNRATRGVGGVSAMQQRIYGMSWAAGFAALFAIEGATAHQGASAAVMGVLGASGPLLVTGLIYLLGAAIWLDRTMFGLGVWLAACAAVAAWAGPVGALLIGALAGGGGFLATAALTSRGRRLAGAVDD